MTNEKSECDPIKKTCCQIRREHGHLYCYQCHLPCDICHKQSDKLAEAKKLIENLDKEISDAIFEAGIRYNARYKDRTTNYYPHFWTEKDAKSDMEKMIQKLIAAASLISYERGREEQREKMVKDISPMCGIPDASDACRAILKYLNPTSDAK